MRITRSTIDNQALYEAIDKKRDVLGLSWRETSRQITGSTTSTLGPRLREGKPITADMLGSIMMWLNVYDMRMFLVAFRPGRRYASGRGGVTDVFDDAGR